MKTQDLTKCDQCDNRTMYLTGDQGIPLCLDCYFKYAQIHQQLLENAERMLNYNAQLMAEEAGTLGLGEPLPQFPPRPRPVVIAGARLLNIHATNSVVGSINTGSIGTVDQSISVLKQSGEPDAAAAVQFLSEAILRSNDLTKNQKNELIESLSVISKEAASPKEARQNTVALSLLEKSMKITAVAHDITDICQKWWPILQAVFMISGG